MSISHWGVFPGFMVSEKEPGEIWYQARWFSWDFDQFFAAIDRILDFDLRAGLHPILISGRR